MQSESNIVHLGLPAISKLLKGSQKRRLRTGTGDSFVRGGTSLKISAEMPRLGRAMERVIMPGWASGSP